MADSEFTIRVTGMAPPLPTSSSSSSSPTTKKKGKKKAATTSQSQQQQQQCRYNLRLRPSSSIDTLRKDVFALFNIPSDYTHSYQMSFLGGFPPKELDQQGKSTVDQLGIRPNESYTIRFTLVDGAVTNNDTKQPAVDVAAAVSSASNGGRQKRASAMAATANFKDVIAAQDALMKQDSKKSPKKKKKSTTIAAASAGGNVVGFASSSGNAAKRNNASSSKAAASKKKKVKMEGEGYRLSDGKSFAGSSSSSKKRVAFGTAKQEGNAMFKSEDDVTNKLLSSLGGGGGSTGGNVGKFLRTAMKSAVSKSYEASRAAVRVTAVNTGEYSFEKVKGGSIVDGGGVVLGTASDQNEGDSSAAEEPNNELRRTLYTVSYSKGMEGRGRYDEQVEIIGLAMLKGVLEHVYNSSDNDTSEEDCSSSEGGGQDGRLRPVMIAQLSPRAFWSLVFHSTEAAHGALTTQLSLDDMLRSTLPQLDWSHLERGGRKRALSEKARENLRQSQPAVDDTSQNHDGGEEETRAIEELGESALNAAIAEDAEGHDDHEISERERRANAALARFGGNTNTTTQSPASSPSASQRVDNVPVDNWALVTPTEDDIDELTECIKEAPSSKEQWGVETEEISPLIAEQLMGCVPNWRVLANSNAETISSFLAGCDCGEPPNGADQVQEWIDNAQVHALEEIMLEILDGDQDALELLQDNANSSSPRDLVNWEMLPGNLADTLSSADATSKSWKRSDITRWIGRAKIALGTCTWLLDYTSQST